MLSGLCGWCGLRGFLRGFFAWLFLCGFFAWLFCVGFLRGSVGFSFSFIKKVVKKGLDNKIYRFILL